MQKTDKWSDQVSFYRFWSNPQVKESALLDGLTNHCVSACGDVPHILLIEDTSELNLESHRNRITDKTGLGLVGNNTDLGFFCHPTIAINPEDKTLLGVLDLHLYHREENKVDKRSRKYGYLPFRQKESYRWSECAVRASERLKGSSMLTVVQDREGDIYESFNLLQSQGLHFVIRSNYNRTISEGSKLHDWLENSPIQGKYEVEIKEATSKRKKRKAQMDVRYGTIELKIPERLTRPQQQEPQKQSSIKLQVVHVKESAESIPEKEEPIEWVLYTTHEVETLTDALQIVSYYQLRWTIEDLFRTVKSEGVNYEVSELETGEALRKLFIVSLMAAIQILQLRQARDGQTKQKPSLTFTLEQISYMKKILPHFEGKTEKQKNPYLPDNLAWATWIIARLGGWKVYLNRPPGVIILMEGWKRFHTMFEGWKMTENCV